jgi:thioredoxin 1
VLKRIGCRRVAGAALLAGAAAVIAAVGCGASKFTHINETAADFQQHVIRAEEPVLVEFFKGGCPTCWMLEGTLDQLADEYAGRMRFVSFEMMKPYFAITCPEIQKRHRIAYFPTIVLFVKGEEKNRWILDYGIDHYREVLNEVVSAPAEPKLNLMKRPVEKAEAQTPDAKKPAGQKFDMAETEIEKILFDF